MNSDQTTFTIPENGRTTEVVLWTACLVVVRGASAGTKFLLTSDEATVGRADDADVRVAKAGVSRRHALIKRINDKQFQLRDLQSTNGTFVNAQRITEVILKDQDLIAVGDSRLKFIAADSPEQPYYEELYSQAQLDKALQIYNKHYFLNRLDEELIRSQHFNSPLSLIMLDVDHFKRLNDTYGHLAGDGALIHLAEILRANIRQSDVLCRYGGEEFGIIMPQTQQIHALAVAEKLRQIVAETPLVIEGKQTTMTISLGISSDANLLQPYTREGLIVQADRALYQAKAEGRNRVVLFRPASHD